MFVHTFFSACAIIIDVTPPNTLYSFCYTPKETKYLLLKSLATPPGFSLYKNNEENPGFVRVGHSPDCGIFLVYLSKFRYNRDANSKYYESL